MILNKSLASVCDDQNIRYSRVYGFLNYILDSRLVHDWEHFFRKALGGRQNACAKARRGYYRFCNFHFFLR